MTKISIECYNILFFIDNNTNPTINCTYKGECQGILTIDNYGKYSYSHPFYSLYKWFDEGIFPEFFDTENCQGNKRLKIVGVDEL